MFLHDGHKDANEVGYFFHMLRMLIIHLIIEKVTTMKIMFSFELLHKFVFFQVEY